MKIPWLYVEDYYCSKLFVETYVIRKENKNFKQFAKELFIDLNRMSDKTKTRSPQRSLLSVEDKIKNICYEIDTNYKNLGHTCKIPVFSHISVINKEALKRILEENGLI